MLDILLLYVSGMFTGSLLTHYVCLWRSPKYRCWRFGHDWRVTGVASPEGLVQAKKWCERCQQGDLWVLNIKAVDPSTFDIISTWRELPLGGMKRDHA